MMNYARYSGIIKHIDYMNRKIPTFGMIHKLFINRADSFFCLWLSVNRISATIAENYFMVNETFSFAMKP